MIEVYKGTNIAVAIYLSIYLSRLEIDELEKVRMVKNGRRGRKSVE